MTQRILFGAVVGGMLGCIVGVLASVAIAYLNQLRPDLANYQRDLWSLTALLLAVILGPIGGVGGVGMGALLVFFRAGRKAKSDV